jgi:hypothetical protein
MNNLGYSNDNLHIGDVRIKGQNETLRIGNENGGDGYILPVEKGSEGDVLTMNADNSTSFKPVSLPTANGRVIQNFFQMTNPQTSYGSVQQPLWLNKNGSDVINRDDLSVGSTVRLRTKGYLYNGDTPSGVAVRGQFSLKIEINNTSGVFDFFTTDVQIEDQGMGSEPYTGRGWWEIHCDITKIDDVNNFATIAVSGIVNYLNASGTATLTRDLIFFDNATVFNTRLPNTDSSNRISPPPFFSPLPPTFTLQVRWATTSGSARAIATEYTIDLLNTNTDILATTISPATDHNTLSNLNVGDPHILYAYLNGRSGGQVLSGGITPANFLTLKSHTAGLNNIVVKDLNTTFLVIIFTD